MSKYNLFKCWRCRKKFKFDDGRMVCFSQMSHPDAFFVINTHVRKYKKTRFNSAQLPQPLCLNCRESFRKWLVAYVKT